ncbi:solute carrier family 22 member 13 [Sphaerodactylus townsendi]|uniref:solute carrier family 22 member 13 n=1 Tax=Sphaerodactylus townsendi TaxID=933632 RepID=UPI002027003B|nr:solute carrier family 22 member 13 [Sphaerodactylus townsendi]
MPSCLNGRASSEPLGGKSKTPPTPSESRKLPLLRARVPARERGPLATGNFLAAELLPSVGERAAGMAARQSPEPSMCRHRPASELTQAKVVPLASTCKYRSTADPWGSEWVGASYRSVLVVLTQCCNAIGQMVLAGLAYGIREWRLYQSVGSAPVFCLFFYIWGLPSSARWLLTRGKVVEARKEIQKAALMNKRSVPEVLLDKLTSQRDGKSGRMLDFLKKPHLRKIILIMAWVWFVDSFVYYGVSLHVGNFGLDIYMTQLVFGVVEIPARLSCIFLLHRLGRKKCQAAWFLLGGAVCLIIPAIPKTLPVIVTVLAVTAKAALAASFSTTYVFSTEVFPTVLRQTCLGWCSISSRIGGILAPLVSLLDEIHPAISMALFGSSALVGGILCFFLPETRNRDLPDDTTMPPSKHP